MTLKDYLSSLKAKQVATISVRPIGAPQNGDLVGTATSTQDDYFVLQTGNKVQLIRYEAVASIELIEVK